jgi:hypothetical protein
MKHSHLLPGPEPTLPPDVQDHIRELLAAAEDDPEFLARLREEHQKFLMQMEEIEAAWRHRIRTRHLPVLFLLIIGFILVLLAPASWRPVARVWIDVAGLAAFLNALVPPRSPIARQRLRVIVDVLFLLGVGLYFWMLVGDLAELLR